MTLRKRNVHVVKIINTLVDQNLSEDGLEMITLYSYLVSISWTQGNKYKARNKNGTIT